MGEQAAEGCIDENVLAAFFEGDLQGEQAAAVEAHLDTCEDCRLVLAVLGRTQPRENRTIGRYEVLGLLGQGGMGVVYLARDPVLGRRVALKLIRPESGRDSELRGRLLREAQTMAKLAHPNIAAVYDVGEVDGRVFVALEYVEGTTLAGWVAETRRSWREVLDMMIAAGRGLVAAHAASVVHRDFKPANVLIGDGRPRVADFGIARANAEPAVVEGASDVITRRGAVIGSPAYMAPEQLAGGVADERSDQFSFCVTLYEALAGKRPFPGDTIETLSASIAKGPPETRSAPRRVLAIVRRGLQAEPARRFPSMAALVQALERARRVPVGVVVGGVAAIAIATVVGVAMLVRDRGPSCELGDQLADVWGAKQREEVRTAVLATKASYAASTAELVTRQLDDYKRAWLAMRTDVCEATHVRGEQSVELLDRRMSCLDRRKIEIDALVRSLLRVDAKSVAKVIDATRALPEVATCRDAPPAVAHDPKLLAELADARSANLLGRYADAYTIATRVKTTDAQVAAEAQLLAGLASGYLGEFARADGELRDAALAAEANKLDDLAAEARIHRVKAAVENSQVDAANEHILAARAAVQRAGSPPRLAEQLVTQEGILLARQGKFEDARTRFQTAVELVGDRDPARIAAALNNIAGSELSLGQLDKARTHYEQALALRVRALGELHPVVGSTRTNLGAVLSSLGEREAALAQFQSSLAILVPALGAEHPRVVNTLLELAGVLVDLGRHAEALEQMKRALEIETKRGAERPEVAAIHATIGDALHAAGKDAEALDEYRVALAMREKLLGAEHPHVAGSLNNMGNTLLALGRNAEARAAFERAIALKTKALGKDAPSLMPSLVGLAEVELAAGQSAKAIKLLDRALVLSQGGDPADRKTIEDLLARARK